MIQKSLYSKSQIVYLGGFNNVEHSANDLIVLPLGLSNDYSPKILMLMIFLNFIKT